MKMKMTVRKRTKIDGISGVATQVTLLVDLKIAEIDVQVTLGIPEKDYDQFVPGSVWEAELTNAKNV